MRVPALILALAALLAPARAATFEVMKLPDGRPVVRMSGDIELGDGTKFAGAMHARPVPVALVLTGEGGNTDAAMKIGMTARMFGMETIVPGGVVCASACALTWTAGAPMAAGQGARIGFHGAYLVENGVLRRSEAGSALVGIYLKRLGFEDATVAYMTAAEPRNMTWLKGEEAAHMHLRIVQERSMEPKPLAQ